MITWTGEGEGKQVASGLADRTIEVEVLDIKQDIASVLVRSEPYYEYLHLVRTRDGWKSRQCSLVQALSDPLGSERSASMAEEPAAGSGVTTWLVADAPWRHPARWTGSRTSAGRRDQPASRAENDALRGRVLGQDRAEVVECGDPLVRIEIVQQSSGISDP